MTQFILGTILLVTFLALILIQKRFWDWKIIKDYEVQTDSPGYMAFISIQLITILLIMMINYNEQIRMVIGTFEPFGTKAITFWTLVGYGFMFSLLSYVISALVSFMVSQRILKMTDGIFQKIESFDKMVLICYGLAQLAISIITTSYMLQPILFQLISKEMGLMPLN